MISFIPLIPASCSALSSPENGAVILSTDGYTTVASFTCDTDYSMKGSSLLTCRNDGSWDLVQPSCGMFNRQASWRLLLSICLNCTRTLF